MEKRKRKNVNMKESLIELEITTIVNGGYGLGRHKNCVIMTPFTYPGDIVQIKTISDKKNMAWGIIDEIIRESPNRIEKKCPYMGICGGCMWGMLSYQKQIEYKRNLIKENIKRFLNIDEPDVKLEYNANHQYYYRTRVNLHGNGNKLGFYKFHSKEIIELHHCVLIHPKIKELWEDLSEKKIINDITITININTDEYYLFTINKDKYLLNNYKYNYNYSRQQHERFYFIYKNIPIVNGSFSQNSLILNDLLKNQVTPWLQMGDKILDLYSGSGNLTIDQPQTKHIIGIDIDPFAITVAKNNSKFDYITGDEEVMIKYLEDESWDIVLLDPPRTGAKKIIPSLSKSKTKYIIYVSCEPVTMFRDIKNLISEGWKISSVTAVDMFPQTPHIECITVLNK